MGKLTKNLGMYLVLIVLVVSLVNVFFASPQNSKDVEPIVYSKFMQLVEAGDVKNVTIDTDQFNGTINGTLKNGDKFKTFVVGAGD